MLYSRGAFGVTCMDKYKGFAREKMQGDDSHDCAADYVLNNINKVLIGDFFPSENEGVPQGKVCYLKQNLVTWIFRFWQRRIIYCTKSLQLVWIIPLLLDT